MYQTNQENESVLSNLPSERKGGEIRRRVIRKYEGKALEHLKRQRQKERCMRMMKYFIEWAERRKLSKLNEINQINEINEIQKQNESEKPNNALCSKQEDKMILLNKIKLNDGVARVGNIKIMSKNSLNGEFKFKTDVKIIKSYVF